MAVFRSRICSKIYYKFYQIFDFGYQIDRDGVAAFGIARMWPKGRLTALPAEIL